MLGSSIRRILMGKMPALFAALILAASAIVGFSSKTYATGSGSQGYNFYLFDSTGDWPGVWGIQCNASATGYTEGQYTVTNSAAGFSVPNGRTYPFELDASYYAFMHYHYSNGNSTITMPTSSSMGPPQDYFHAYWSYDDLVLQGYAWISADSTCNLLVLFPWYFTPGPSVYRVVDVTYGGYFQVAP